MDKFRISEALMSIYRLFRDEFSSWYLEMVKPAYGSPIDAKTYSATLRFFDMQLRLLHPFMPFITEELWQHLEERADGESIMYARMPESGKIDRDILKAFETVKEIVAGVRTIRKQKQIPGKQPLTLLVAGAWPEKFAPVLEKMAGLEKIEAVAEKPAGAATFRVDATEYSVPLQGNVNVDEEKAKINADLNHLRGFLKGVEKNSPTSASSPTLPRP